MTNDSTSGSIADATSTTSSAPAAGETPATEPTKPARRARRATSPAKAPAAPVGTAAAPGTGTAAPAAAETATAAVAADEAPSKPARRTRKKVTPAAESAGAPEAAAAQPAEPAAVDAPAEAPKKPTRRRATRATAAAAAPEPSGDAATVGTATTGAATAGSLAAAPVAADAQRPAARATRAAKSPVAGTVADEAPGAAPRRRRATRATAAAEPAGTGPATPAAEAAPVDVAPADTLFSSAAPVTAPSVAPAAEPVAEAPQKPARRSRRVTRPTASAATAGAPADVPMTAATAPAEPVAVVDVPVEEDEELVAEAAAPALDVFAELGAAQAAAEAAGSPAIAPEKPQQPGSGRLATTALLFQAPEARPRRRRASAPSGSPEAVSAAAHVLEDLPAPAAEVPAEQPEQAARTERPERPEQETASTGSRRSRGRRGSRSARSAERPEALGTEASIEDDEATLPVEVPADGPVDEQTDVQDVSGEQPDEADPENDDEGSSPRRRRRRGGRGRRSRGGSDSAEGDDAAEGADGTDRSADADEAGEPDQDEDDAQGSADADEAGGSRRRRRRRRSGRGGDDEGGSSSSRSRSGARGADEVTALRGSTRLEAKRQRRREGRDAGRRRQIITEAEFLARREAVERSMVVREAGGKTQIAVLEDGVLVEHYVSRQASVSMAGNVYLGRVQNVLPSMEAAFVDVGKGRNAVLYAGEVNWDAAGLDGGQPRRIEQALKSGDSVLVQVTKDPIGHKGARLTSQITLAGRYLVYVPGGGMTGISRKLPENERARLKKILREAVPDSAGVIVRTAAEGASEEELRADIVRLQSQWEAIEKKSKTASAPSLLQGEPDLAIRVVRDIFNDDFTSLVVQGDEAWSTISGYVGELAPDLAERVTRWTGVGDVFAAHRVDEQLAKGMDRKVWLPSGGSLVIDRTEAMTVVDVNTGKFTGAGGTLEETVTRNNLEAAEEIVRQLRLRDIGGIIVIDFIDMVLESNRDLVLRRLVECLGRDRTKHQVAEVTSLGLVQMTRKRVGQGLVEAFSETCEHCNGRGFIVHTDPVEKNYRPDAGAPQQPVGEGESKRARRKRGAAKEQGTPVATAAAVPVLPEAREAVKATLATIAAAAAHAHVHDEDPAAEVSAAPVPEVGEVEGPPQPAETVAPVSEPVAPVAAEPLVLPEDVVAVAPAPRSPRRRATRARGSAEPALDVLAALGDLAPKHDAAPASSEVVPADGLPAPRLSLSPVDPGLFELADLAETVDVVVPVQLAADPATDDES